MKLFGAVVFNLSLILLSSSSAMAGSGSSLAAKQDLQIIEKFKESSISKGILQRHCKKMPAIAELCKGSASDLQGADLSEVKEAVVADLEKEASGEVQSQAVNVSTVSGSNSSVNVSSGSGNSQSSTSTGTAAAYPGAECVKQVMTNMNNFMTRFNNRANKI